MSAEALPAPRPGTAFGATPQATLRGSTPWDRSNPYSAVDPAQDVAPLTEPSQRIWRALVDAGTAAPSALLVVEATGAVPRLEEAKVIWANRAADELLRVSSGQLMGVRLDRLLAPLALGEFRPEVLRAERAGRATVAVLTADGTRRQVLLQALPSPLSRTWTLSITLAGTPAERAAQEQAGAQERRFATLVESSPVATIISEAGLRLAHVNDAFCALVGRTDAELLGTGWISCVAEDDLPLVLESVADTLQGESTSVQVRLQRTDGQTRWVQLRLAPAKTPGQGAGFVGTAEDFTDRRAFEQQLAHQARHCALTGLPNRTALMELMTQRLPTSSATSTSVPSPPSLVSPISSISPASPMTCIFLDLDNFKVVNDSLGHDAGDKLLVAVAERLRSVVRTGDVVTRWGGDEFVILCDGVAEDVDAHALGEKILARLHEGFAIDGVHFTAAASIGVTRVTSRHRSPEDVLQDCDIAMYRAKRAGRDRVALCDGDARHQAHQALVLTLELREALAAGELTVAYQPVLDLHDPAGLPAVEALVRWHHPTRGTVPPELLVQTAEANGLIDVLGMFVLRQACAQLVTWQRELGDLAPGKVNVNLSAIQLCSPTLVPDVTAVLTETGLAPARLCLEVTETALMQDRDSARAKLLALRGLGVPIALDDFGTGYSSLAYLRQLPVDYLKVDRSFVTEISQGHPQVAKAVIGLAHSLGLTAVAEGVEHPDQAEELRAMGAELVQGWLYAAAMSPEALAQWRRAHAGRPSPGSGRGRDGVGSLPSASSTAHAMTQYTPSTAGIPAQTSNGIPLTPPPPGPGLGQVLSTSSQEQP